MLDPSRLCAHRTASLLRVSTVVAWRIGGVDNDLEHARDGPGSALSMVLFFIH